MTNIYCSRLADRVLIFLGGDAGSSRSASHVLTGESARFRGACFFLTGGGGGDPGSLGGWDRAGLSGPRSFLGAWASSARWYVTLEPLLLTKSHMLMVHLLLGFHTPLSLAHHCGVVWLPGPWRQSQPV